MKSEQRFAQFCTDLVYRYAFWIAGLIILLTCIAFPYASKLSLRANFLDLLPKDMESVVNLNRLTSEVGGTSYLIVVIESPDEATAQAAAENFSAEAALYPETDYVDNRTDLDKFKYTKLLFLKKDSLEKLDDNVDQVIGYYRRKHNPFFVNLLEEEEAPTIDVKALEVEEKVHKIGGFTGKENGNYMRVVLLKPKHPVSDFPVSAQLFERAHQTLQAFADTAGQPMTFGFTGPYKTRYDEYHVIQSDLKRTGILTFGLITALMFSFFSTKRSLLLTYLTLSIGILWTCAFAYLTIGFLNIITGFILGILFGLGIDFAIHFLVRYGEARTRGFSHYDAVKETYFTIGGPSLTSAVTTGIAFFSLVGSEFLGFRHFGVIAGVGISLCFLVIFFGLPSFIFVLEKIKPSKWKPRFKSRFQIGAIPKNGIKTVVVLGILMTTFSLIRFPMMRFEYNFAAIQEEGADSIELAMRIGDHFGVVLNPVGLITPDRDSAVKLAHAVNAHAAATPGTWIDFAAAVTSHVPREQEAKREILARIDTKLAKKQALIDKLEDDQKKMIQDLRDQLHPVELTLEDIPSGVREQYEGKHHDVSVVYVYPVSSLLDGNTAKKFVTELRSLDLPEGVVLAGEPVIYADILFLLERDMPRAMGMSLGIVVLLLLIHFRSVRDTLWVLAPVLIGITWIGGLSYFTGFKFNYLNVTILPSILGVGIDNGIHIFHRFKHEKKSTLKEIMHKTGRAVVMSSLTTAAAFGSLCMARHRGMASLGELGLLGFTSCLITSTMFIPALIELWAGRGGKKQHAVV